MEVIGIVQTDLNEFNILFQEAQQQNNQQGKQQQNQNNSGGGGNSSGMDMGFFSFLGGDDTQEENQQSGQQSNGQQSNGQNGGSGKSGGGDQSQEMTVRIKGIPEGDKATFLQMYQLINDAKESKELELKLTILNRGGNEQGGGGEGKQKKEGGSKRNGGGTRSMSQSKGS